MVSFTIPTIIDYDEVGFHNIRKKIQVYLDVYDGTEKTYEEMTDEFEALFHDDFIHTMDGRIPINKDQMRATVKTFLSVGSKAELLLFKPLDYQTFEVKLHVVNRLADLQSHSMGTVRDGKIIRLQAYEDSKPTYRKWNNMVGMTEVARNLAYFIELQNDKDISLDDIEDAFDRLFYDNLSAAIHRVPLHKRGLCTTSSDTSPRAKFILEKCEIIDQTHLEVKMKVLRDGFLELWHDVLTVKDAAIVMIEPYDHFDLRITKEEEKLASAFDTLSCSLESVAGRVY